MYLSKISVSNKQSLFGWKDFFTQYIPISLPHLLPDKTKSETILYKQKTNTIKNPNKEIWGKKPSENTIEYVMCGHLLLSMGPAIKCGLYRWDSVGESQLFLCKKLSVEDSFLVRDVIFCPLPSLCVSTPSDLVLCRDCACCHHLCKLISGQFWCVWKTLFPRSHPFPLVLKIFSPPLPHISSNFEWRGLMKACHLGTSVPKSLPLCTFSSCVSLYYSHLLQEEASLMMA